MLISHASKVMLKILQARLRQYLNWEHPDAQAGFRKGRGTRDQLANIHWIIEKARKFQKTSISASLTMLKPSLKDFEHYLASMWNERYCMVVWTFFGIPLLWDWNENWLFPVLWPVLSVPNLLTYWMQHFNSIISGFEIIQLEFQYFHYLSS